MGVKDDKTGAKKLRVFKGDRKDEDIYDRCKKDKAIDIDGEVVGDGPAGA